MARWTLSCPKCRFVFVHSSIEIKEAADYFLPAKPALACMAATEFRLLKIAATVKFVSTL